jgi:iron complex outermembrane recepter protein
MSAIAQRNLRRSLTRYSRSIARAISVTSVCGAIGVAAAADLDRKVVEEVIVTAQKREQSLQDVPISMAVLGGEELNNSTFSSVADALATSPSLDLGQAQYVNGVLPSMRGVSNGQYRGTGPAPVAYYIDGVPYGFVRAAFVPADASVYDLARIEVLRGPQGTLYGAGALAGAIRILTQDANADAFDFSVRAFGSGTEGGGQNSGGDLMVNVPLIEGRLAARAVVGYRDDSGWIDSPIGNDVNDSETQSYRFKVHAQPTDALSLDFSLWHSENEAGAPGMSNDDGTITSVQDQSRESESDVYGIEIRYDFSSFSVSSVTSYMDFNDNGTLDGTPFVGVPITLAQELSSEVFSEEINLISDLEGPWRWSAGVFYRDAEDSSFQFRNLFLPAINNDYTDKSESYAVYGEVGRHLGDHFELAVGLRYFHDEQSTQINQPYAPVSPAIGVDDIFKGTSEAVTPRVLLTYTPTDDRMMYASYSEGFRSGLVQQPNVQALFPNFTPADPDRLRNYEFGIKSSEWQGLTFEGAVFYMDWRDIQQAVIVILPVVNLSTTAVVNGKSASGLGAEFGFTARPFDGFELSGAVGWNDMSFDEAVTDAVNAVVIPKGARPQFSPEYTASTSAAYTWGLGGGFDVQLGVDASYKSRREGYVRNNPQRFVGETSLLTNAHFTLKSPQNWSLRLFADNLADEYDSQTVVLPGINIPQWRDRVRPRTFGLQAEYGFQ